MKNHFALLFIPLLMLLVGLAGASYWFQVIDVTPIEMTPHSEANFTVSVKGLGSERAFVELVFKNKTEGLDFTCQKMIKNVYPAGVTKYNCTAKAEDVPPGIYSFVVDVAAKGSPSGKKTAFINVLAAKSDAAINASGTDQDNRTPAEAPAKQEAQKTPASGAIVAIFAVLVAMQWMKR